MKLKERAEETAVERIVACLSAMNRWATIDEFVDALDEADFWDESFHSKVEGQAKKQFIRRMIRKAEDEADWPICANVKIQDAATGVEVRVYKQESLFDVADYAQVCCYHRQAGLRHLGMARGYRDRAELFDQIRAALLGAKKIAQLQAAWSLTNGKKTRLGDELFTQLQTTKDSRKAELLEVARASRQT